MSKLRISTHISQEANASVSLDGDTWTWVTQQCPRCAGMTLATNGVILRCPACEWSGAMVKHKPRTHKEHVYDEW